MTPGIVAGVSSLGPSLVVATLAVSGCSSPPVPTFQVPDEVALTSIAVVRGDIPEGEYQVPPPEGERLSDDISELTHAYFVMETNGGEGWVNWNAQVEPFVPALQYAQSFFAEAGNNRYLVRVRLDEDRACVAAEGKRWLLSATAGTRSGEELRASTTITYEGKCYAGEYVLHNGVELDPTLEYSNDLGT